MNIVEYNQTEQALVTLREKYLNIVFDVRTTAGMKAAKEGRADLRSYRTDLEKKRVEIKASSLERCRLIDSEAKRIEKELAAMEDPINLLIKNEEKRKEEEKLELLRRENVRISAIEAKIEKIRNYPSLLMGASSDDLYLVLDSFTAHQIDDSFQEFKEKAMAAFIVASDALKKMFNAKLKEEAEQERIKAERAELEKLRAEQQEREAEELQRRAAENARIDAERKAEAAHFKARRDEEEALLVLMRKAEQEKIDAEERRLQVERHALAKEREAIAQEKARQEQAVLTAKHEEEEKEFAAEQAEQIRRTIKVTKGTKEKSRPTDDEIIDVIALHFHVHESKVIEWLLDMDLSAAMNRIVAEMQEDN